MIKIDLSKTTEEIKKLKEKKNQLEKEMIEAIRRKDIKEFNEIHNELDKIINELLDTKKRLKILV